ncbi:MAG: hypothetical protein ACLUUO_03030 [Sellimonas intestinalis]
MIVKAVAIELEHHKDRAWCSISMERQIVSEIVLGGKHEIGEGIHMKEKMEQSYLIPGFLLGIVRCTDHKHLGKLQSIRNQIYEKDQELLSYLSGDKLYLLFTGRKEEQKTAEFLREVGQAFGVRICVGELIFRQRGNCKQEKVSGTRVMQTGTKMDPCKDFSGRKSVFSRRSVPT